MIQDHRHRFNKIILYPSKQHGVVDLEDLWLKSFPETWVERQPIDYGVNDWRQAETEPLIELSDAEWLLFMEADFFVTNWDKLFKDVEEAAANGSEMIGCWSPSQFPYVHPCFLLMKRSLFDKTNKDFRAHPEILGSDHFAMLTRDAERLGAKITILEDMGYKEWEDYFHLGGLTYAFQDWKGPTTHFGMKSPEAYYVYLHYTKDLPGITYDPRYLKQAEEIEEVLRKKYPDLDLENNKWIKFYSNLI